MTARLTIAAARPGMRVLIREIERAGLIAQEPRTPLPAMYCGADAFTEIQQEATRDAG